MSSELDILAVMSQQQLPYKSPQGALDVHPLFSLAWLEEYHGIVNAHHALGNEN